MATQAQVHGIVMLLAACDFSGAVMPDGVPITPQIAFDLTREFVAYGLAPAQLVPASPSPSPYTSTPPSPEVR